MPLCSHDKFNLRCVEFIQAEDGNSLYFNIPNIHPLLGENILVEVQGLSIPAPDATEKCERFKAKLSKNLVTNILQVADRIDLENVKRDKGFNLIAEVTIDGLSLKKFLIQNRLAKPLKKNKEQVLNWCDS